MEGPLGDGAFYRDADHALVITLDPTIALSWAPAITVILRTNDRANILTFRRSMLYSSALINHGVLPRNVHLTSTAINNWL